MVHSNERVPADIVLLYTTEKQGSIFIRTDQLDGETDWKVRRPITFTQKHVQENVEDLLQLDTADLKYEGPTNLIYDYSGIFSVTTMEGEVREGLGLDHTLWADTVLAS